MKITLELPDELIRAAELRAIMQGRPLKDLMAEFLRQGLGMASQAANTAPASGSMVTIGQDGLPVIRCATDAPAARMDATALLRLEQAALAAEDRQRGGIPV
jgi:plasmid stability protein